MSADRRLDPPMYDGRFGDDDTEAILTDARLFAEEIYFRDTAEIHMVARVEDSIGAGDDFTYPLRYDDPVPCHTRRISAQYAAEITDGPLSGRGDTDVVSSQEQEICFPLETFLTVGDKVKVIARNRVRGGWFTVNSVDDTGTDSLMVVCRATRIGVPDGLAT